MVIGIPSLTAKGRRIFHTQRVRHSRRSCIDADRITEVDEVRTRSDQTKEVDMHDSLGSLGSRARGCLQSGNTSGSDWPIRSDRFCRNVGRVMGDVEDERTRTNVGKRMSNRRIEPSEMMTPEVRKSVSSPVVTMSETVTLASASRHNTLAGSFDGKFIPASDESHSAEYCEATN